MAVKDQMESVCSHLACDSEVGRTAGRALKDAPSVPNPSTLLSFASVLLKLKVKKVRRPLFKNHLNCMVSVKEF